jgi:hypothetical protein
MSQFILGIRLRNKKNEISLSDIKFDDIMPLCLSCDRKSNLSNLETDEIIIKYAKKIDQPNNNCKVEDDEYNLYTRVEYHMKVSMSLYMLNRQGQDILKEVGVKKLGLPLNHIVSGTFPQAFVVKRRENGKMQPNKALTIYQNMRDIVNFNRINSDVYVELLNQLDEVLFNECKDIDMFYVKEDSYSLESLYYKQESWISEVEWQDNQIFAFVEGETFDVVEITHLLMYLGKISSSYKSLLDRFQYHKIRETLTKILHKVDCCLNLVNSMLMNMLEDDDTFTR